MHTVSQSLTAGCTLKHLNHPHLASEPRIEIQNLFRVSSCQTQISQYPILRFDSSWDTIINGIKNMLRDSCCKIFDSIIFFRKIFIRCRQILLPYSIIFFWTSMPRAHLHMPQSKNHAYRTSPLAYREPFFPTNDYCFKFLRVARVFVAHLRSVELREVDGQYYHQIRFGERIGSNIEPKVVWRMHPVDMCSVSTIWTRNFETAFKTRCLTVF